MKFYNTISRKVEDFKPQNDNQVTLYTCGPTVYDFAHIGNLRSFVFDDTLRRALEVNGYALKHVMNITDVGHLASDADEGEDKLEKGARRENKSVWEIADFYIQAFEDDFKELNILPPNAYIGKRGVYARATDFIPQQLEIVQLLIDKGFAYKTEQAIYFDVTKLNDYGKLTGQKIADKEVAARSEVVVDANKHHPQDFALWFFKVGRFADHSMSWASQWGEGFPGWHLECSAIIHATLGEPLDIHTGGVDHIGTHHTNEMAQTEAAYGVELAKYWLHNEHLLADGQKMAKSSGNFYTLKDVKDKDFDPLALRILFLQSHYRSQASFNWETLEAAQKNLVNLRALADLRFQTNSSSSSLSAGYFQERQEQILANLNNDLATPAALAKLDAIADELSQDGLSSSDLAKFNRFLEFIDQLLGLNFLESQDITSQQKALITDRETAREASDWKRADALRNQLSAHKIEINDTHYGPIWRRI